MITDPGLEECEICGRWFKFVKPGILVRRGGESIPSEGWCEDCSQEFIKCQKQGRIK